MKASFEIRITGDEKILKSLYNSLYPETVNPPSQECSSHIDLREDLVIKVECSRINLLRAVANSYLSIISMITRSLEVQEHG